MGSPKTSFNMKSIKKISNSLLKNKYTLYVIALIALLNILGYLSQQNNSAVIFFIIIGVLTTYFSENMIIVLCHYIDKYLCIIKNVIS